jgi:hypothetical protein
MGQLGQLQLGDILVEVVAVDATLPELPEKVVKVEEEMELPVVVKGELEVMALVEAVAELAVFRDLLQMREGGVAVDLL